MCMFNWTELARDTFVMIGMCDKFDEYKKFCDQLNTYRQVKGNLYHGVMCVCVCLRGLRMYKSEGARLTGTSHFVSRFLYGDDGNVSFILRRILLVITIISRRKLLQFD